MLSLLVLVSVLKSSSSNSCIQSKSSSTGCHDMGGKCEKRGGMCFQMLDNSCCCSEALEECMSSQPLGGVYVKDYPRSASSFPEEEKHDRFKKMDDARKKKKSKAEPRKSKKPVEDRTYHKKDEL